METGQENGGNGNLKRQRAPLSDSEDNVLTSSVINDGQKRRRMEAAGTENRSPKPSTSGRSTEQEIKPDTPMVPSIISRVQQLTQRREGAQLPQRCSSDPGADSPLAAQDKGFRKQLLGEAEFNQRLERFKVPVFQTSPTPSSESNCPRTRSNFVSDIHQKLQGDVTPSSKQASRIRQEREKELNQLQFQPVSENAWLKRSSSDPSFPQGRTPTGASSPSSVPRSRRRVQWPPVQPWDADDMKDGSFTESSTSHANNAPMNTTAGKTVPRDSEVPPTPVEELLQIECNEQNAPQREKPAKERDDCALPGNEVELLVPQETQTVMKLSFSEDQKASTNEEKQLELTSPADETNQEETGKVSRVDEQSIDDVFSCEDEQMDESSYCDEVLEPSTDEEFKLWRYPQDSVSKEEESVVSEEPQEEEGESSSSQVEEGKSASVADHNEPSDIQDSECSLGDSSTVVASSAELQEDKKLRAEENPSDQVTTESYNPCNKEKGDANTGVLPGTQNQEGIEGCLQEDEHSKETIGTDGEHADLVANDGTMQMQSSPLVDEVEAQTAEEDIQRIDPDVAEPMAENVVDSVFGMIQSKGSNSNAIDKMHQEESHEKRGCLDRLTEDTQKAEGEGSKKVTFTLVSELINDSGLSQASTSVEPRAETSMSDAELSSHDDTNTNEIIDQMFGEVLEYAERMEEEAAGRDEDAEDCDSGISGSGDKDKMDLESEKEKSEEEEGVEAKEECDGDELLTFPPSGILSPLSKSVEAVVTPMRLAASQESNPPSLLLTPGGTPTPPVESAPLYSVDAYRTQRQTKLPTIQSVTPGVQGRAPEKSQPRRPVNTKERITALNEEAGKLQTVINQTLQALSCCTDEVHGRGSLEEAEAEKLLLVSCEKRSALLAEVSRLRQERNLESGQDEEDASQLPCRGTVDITNIQLPLKVEFVCSSHNRTGRPSHYFFILIRYGPCNIIATPLATAADAQNGDTISFPTSITLKDIRSSFEIDVEVYSLTHTAGGSCNTDRITTKSRVTPRKLLNTLTRSSHALASANLPALNPRRSSNFCLVGSHKLSLASLGHSKFPLDKMKFEGKIRRLLGDEFQEKVPFLSPLEGNIYLRLDSQGHSNVQHQGFLTMFELISGYGVWHRRYFVLDTCSMFYWNHPNDRETKESEGCISLFNSPSLCVRPVQRDSCARPFTFELVSSVQHQEQDNGQEVLAKCWFSADTKQERADWMEKLGQALLDFQTWNRPSAAQAESRPSNASDGNLRESIL